MDPMTFFEIPVAWILVQVHWFLTLIGLPSGTGVAWVLSIVGLTVIVRILIIPLFFKQIKAQRGMQLMQPEMQALQKKYKGKTDPASRQAQQQEMMAMYKKHGANPFSSCLPMLAQAPIFLGIFQVLRAIPEIAAGTYPKYGGSIGPLNAQFAQQLQDSHLFGAPLSSSFLDASRFPNPVIIQIVTGMLIVFMVATQFFSMRMLAMKNMPDSAKEGPMYKQQRMMMVVFPFIFLFSGPFFQVGLLIYWTVSNLWAVGQQFYTIRKQPVPGSEAHKAKVARDAERRIRKGLPPLGESTEAEVQAAGQRSQPVGKSRSKKKSRKPERSEEGASEATEEEASVAEVSKAANGEGVSGGDLGRGKDGLTAEERAQRRYEARAAQRKAARDKRLAAEKRKREEQGRYN